MEKKLSRIIFVGAGASMFFIGIGLAWYWFSWKLALCLFLGIWGSNIERHR